jgi:hypothetical protein
MPQSVSKVLVVCLMNSNPLEHREGTQAELKHREVWLEDAWALSTTKNSPDLPCAADTPSGLSANVVTSIVTDTPPCTIDAFEFTDEDSDPISNRAVPVTTEEAIRRRKLDGSTEETIMRRTRRVPGSSAKLGCR